ncbi:hypothetical protein, partial [uncultured Flavobacterium sp.]|uniref:hypothetical protein n=1 Tax=uncultured Flavobacterium sp. TaxID=165435 RepID=UPI0025CC9F28
MSNQKYLKALEALENIKSINEYINFLNEYDEELDLNAHYKRFNKKNINQANLKKLSEYGYPNDFIEYYKLFHSEYELKVIIDQRYYLELCDLDN